MLEAMVSEAKMNPSIPNDASSLTNKIDKNSVRPRGSGSPFKCISSLVQQMNSEKDKELSLAKLQIKELEALAANRQKQVIHFGQFESHSHLYPFLIKNKRTSCI